MGGGGQKVKKGKAAIHRDGGKRGRRKKRENPICGTEEGTKGGCGVAPYLGEGTQKKGGGKKVSRCRREEKKEGPGICGIFSGHGKKRNVRVGRGGRVPCKKNFRLPKKCRKKNQGEGGKKWGASPIQRGSFLIEEEGLLGDEEKRKKKKGGCSAEKKGNRSLPGKLKSEERKACCRQEKKKGG